MGGNELEGDFDHSRPLVLTARRGLAISLALMGTALSEKLTYDDQANFLSGIFADYLRPTAVEVPPMAIARCTGYASIAAAILAAAADIRRGS